MPVHTPPSPRHEQTWHAYWGTGKINHWSMNYLVQDVLSLMHLSMPSPTPPVRGRWGWGGDLIPYHFNFPHVGQAGDVKSPIFSHQETIYIAHEAKKNCTWKSRPIKSPTLGRKQCINYPTLPHLLPYGGWGLTLIAALYVPCRSVCDWIKQSKPFWGADQWIKVTSELLKSTDQ